MINKKRIYALSLSSMLLLSFFLFQCEEVNNKNILSVLERIPDEDMMVVSVNPKQILVTQFMNYMPESEIRISEVKYRLSEIEARFGIKLEEVENITFLVDDLNLREDEMAAIVKVDARNLNLDGILDEIDAEDEIVKISGYDVHLLRTRGFRRSHEELYLYYDKSEILVSSRQPVLEKLLELKSGKGKSLADNKEFVKRMKNLRYYGSSFFSLPTNGIMQDVARKVRQKNPAFQGNLMNLNTIMGGADISDQMRFSLHAYTDSEAEIEATYDLLHGLKGIATLAAINFPELKNLLNKVELIKGSDYLGVEVSFSPDDVYALEKYKDFDKQLTFRPPVRPRKGR